MFTIIVFFVVFYDMLYAPFPLMPDWRVIGIAEIVGDLPV